MGGGYLWLMQARGLRHINNAAVVGSAHTQPGVNAGTHSNQQSLGAVQIWQHIQAVGPLHPLSLPVPLSSRPPTPPPPRPRTLALSVPSPVPCSHVLCVPQVLPLHRCRAG